MNVAAPFIHRPVATSLIMAGLLVFGVLSYQALPVSDLPNVDFPTIQVQANLPGASPETMASAVATPLEKEFTTIAGLDSMSSASTLGSTQITLQFALDRDLDAAALDVQAAISKVSRWLPRDMPGPPSFRKVNPADSPILFIALTSPTLPLHVLNEYGETYLAQRISTVSGVAQVQVFGSKKFAVRVQLDPDELAARGIGIDEVSRALQSGNVNLPSGIINGPQQAFTLEADGQLGEAAAYRSLIVAWRNGAPVRLEMLGRVLDDVENDKTIAWYGTRERHQRSIMLAIFKQPGTNTVQIADTIRRLLPSFRSSVPPSVQLELLFDRSGSIRESVRDMQLTLLVTLVLVVLVIFLFLRRLSATVIPSLALPISLVGTLAAMKLLGYSLNNLSLMALALSTGFVVDDAIVMLENIVRHMEMGKRPLQAALDGSKEVGFTIVSMTISLAAVFLPVLFLGGILGRLFHEFAVTITVAVLVSGFVSLTLTPMLCGRFLRPPRRSPGRLKRLSERFFTGWLALYRVTLAWSLRHRRLVMLFTAGVLAAMVWLWGLVPKGFLPSEDTDFLTVSTEGGEGISYRAMWEYQQQLIRIVQKNPNVAAFQASAGGRGGAAMNNVGNFFIRLVPRHQRKLSADQVVQELRRELAQVPGVRAFPMNPPPIRIGGRMTKSQYQFTLQSTHFDELYQMAPVLEEKLRHLPLLQDVTSDLQLRNPTIKLEIQRDAASSMGVTAEQIESALYDAYGSRQVSTIFAPENSYQVVMEVLPERQEDPDALSRLYVRSSAGKLVPLAAVARLGKGYGPLSVSHSGQLPAVTISFDLAPGVSLGPATAAIERVARETLPATIQTSFQGTAQAFQDSVAGLGLLLLMAVLVIYLVLGILYESFIHPLTILSALPFAGFGALLTLLAFDTELSIYAFVGVIMLVGLVKKNGIMMVDFALEAARAHGTKAEEAIFEASLVRFRPIMMTTMAALMGTLPIALGLGAGGEARQPLGLAVVGGLLFSQLLTLYVTPVVYVYLDRFQGAVRRGLVRSRREEQVPAEG